MGDAALTTQQAIAAQYRAELPADWTGKHGALADETTIRVLLEAAEHGLNNKSCYEAAGISHTTWHRWQQEAERDPSSAYGTFVNALKEARARGKLAVLKRISAASEKPQFWTAGAWMLERTDPEQFALRKDNADTPKVIVQIGAGAGDVKVGVLVVSPPGIEG